MRTLRPDLSGGSLPNLAVTIARWAGVRSVGNPPLAPPLRRELDPLAGATPEGPIVLLLVDGFGWGNLEGWARTTSPFGRTWAAHSRKLTTVFPSTTTAALTSLSTGTAPGRHGLVGYRQYLPGFGVVADLLKMSAAGLPGTESLIGPEWEPSQISGAPTLFRRGLRAAALTRDRFKATGFTRLLYDGAEFVGYATATEMAEELRKLLLRSRPPPVIFAYWDELDTIQHLKGPRPALAHLELDRLAGLLAHVAGRLPRARRRATRLLVTGDHGQVPSPRRGRIAFDEHPELARLFSRPPSGDRRAAFLSIRRGSEREARRRLREILPKDATVGPTARALSLGWFGPPPHHPEIRERLGDLLVLVPPPYGLTFRLPGVAAPTRHLFGAHGGMDPSEMQVPLIALGFDQLA